ncbi:MAG: dihydrodipicolinate synthase family protein [Proteobacteria bacterium]|nr:dihydrodipicolinate synthase family protein [Pseudomonadota bacterium]
MAARTPTATLAGNIPAVVTPFAPSGDILFDAFAELIEWHIGNGVDGICVAGDNGESWTLSVEERRRLAERAVRQARGRVPVAVGASGVSARQSIAYAEAAAAAGADALMVQPQSYVLKGSTSEIVGRYAALARAVPLPIMAYNSPRRTGLNMEVETLRAVCDVAPVVALKESSRDMFHLTHVLEAMGARLNVLIGPCPFILPGLALGAKGFVSTGPELFGPRARRLMGLGREAPSAEWREWHFALSRVYEALMGTGTWPAALKCALNLLGVPAGVPRDPVQPLGPEQEARLRSAMESLGLLAGAGAARAAG